jgi:hypothetical protein
LEDAAQLYAAATTSSTTTSSAAFLATVVRGQHTLWRPYAYASATNGNRQAFLLAAQRSVLAPSMHSAGRLSKADFTSLLQLLCADFPPGVVKNAWSPALALQRCE